MSSEERECFRSMREVCEKFFPQQHKDRDCNCSMPENPWRAYFNGEITIKAVVKAMNQPRPKWGFPS